MEIRTGLPDYYEILGVGRDAGPSAIDAAFKAEVLKFRDRPGGGEQTRRINLAYRALKDSDRRREYDAALDGARTGPPATAALDPPGRRLDRPAQPALPLAHEEDAPRIEADPPAGKASRARLAFAASAVAIMIAAGIWASGIIEGDYSSAGPGQGAPGQSTAGGAKNAQLPLGEVGAGTGFPSAADTSNRPAADDAATGQDAETVPAPGSGAVGPAASAEAGGFRGPAPSQAPVAGEAPSTVEESQPAETVARPAEPVREEVVAARAPDLSAPPRHISGGLYGSDNRGGRFQGIVGVRISVGTSGRAEGCRVTRSSGQPGLDMVTCSLLQQRLRFAPALDASGNATASEVDSTHSWGRRR